MAGKIVVYTAITGNKDFLKEDQIGNCKFVCFTDKDIISKRWEIRKAHSLFRDDNRNAKIHKILSHQYLDCEWSIWIDGNVYLKTEPKDLIKAVDGYDIGVFPHHEGRVCLYQESEITIGRKLDDVETMRQQVAHYKNSGYPANNGLNECTVIIRRHNEKIVNFNNDWWSEVSRRSKRDQLSFNYSLWLNDLKLKELDGNIKRNDDFVRVQHSPAPLATQRKPVKPVIKGDTEVMLNCSTTYKTKALTPGMVITVPQRIAERWVRTGIAHYDNWEDIKKTFMASEKIKVKKHWPEHPKVSIVMPVKDQLNYTKLCIESIRAFTKDYELIIIDNGSGKETRKYLESLEDVILHRNKINMGVPYSWNQGIKLAKTDYVCFINNDCIVTNNWLEKMMLAFIKNPTAGIVGPTTSYSGSAQCSQLVSKHRYNMSQKEINSYADCLEESYQPLKVQGFCYIVRARVFDIVGGFNHERFKLGNTEENEFTWRVEHMTDYRAFWARGAYVHHYGHMTFTDLKLDPWKYNKAERNKWEKEKTTTACKKYDISEVKVEKETDVQVPVKS